MREDFLHHLWKYRLFDEKNLTTHDGQLIRVIKPGNHNMDAGPDFFNAQLEIGNTHWVGNVEIHVNSNDWEKHKHSQDLAYDNVILHVVHEKSAVVKRKDGTEIPVLELKSRINPHLLHKYNDFQKNELWVPCERHIGEVEDIVVNSWLDRLLIERLEQKALAIQHALTFNKSNWEETFYQHLARSFGFKVNALPFELIARSLPNNLLAKHKGNKLQVESLFFGQAGFLNEEFSGDYPKSLKKEYLFLQNKYQLESIDKSIWKFLRLRPVNFPTIRIAQFAELVNQSSHLFSKIIACKTRKDLHDYFDVAAADYWNSYFLFDKISPLQAKHLGEASIDSIIINTVIPFFFVYGKNKSQQKFIDTALKILEEVPSEKNSILNKWKELGIESKSAYQSQGLIQLKNEYCKSRRCIDCGIGNKIIR